jgi:hypothetical protein
VRTINANGTSPKKQNRNTGAIVGGTIVGVAAIFAVLGVVIFVQRRRINSRPRSALSTDPVDAGPRMIVSPFDPNSLVANRNSGILADSGGAAASSSRRAGDSNGRAPPSIFLPPAVPPLSREVAQVPVGLSDKEMARLRAETLSPPQPHNIVSVLNVSQSTSSLNAVTETGESPLDTRRLPSEFERQPRRLEPLRRQVERLPEEGLVVGRPPSYAEGDR